MTQPKAKPKKHKTWKYVAEVVVATDAPVTKKDVREWLELAVREEMSWSEDRPSVTSIGATHIRVRSVED